ncbi:uncharacterized protein YraI [Fulvimonas soli]|uniref:Uncharacterized protein YraI n=1 Tax=Fulvimonas soli TaxID=155197 RepID=A0A316IZI6_9GAMM|nr:SH3 domain-containing protein [Fulvimonas soli]PWK92685.1 uncharacterized protein YraI [Fulvimonas soli]
MKRSAALAALPLLLALPAAAGAQGIGYVTANVNLRAGPDVGYPRVDTIPAGAAINVQGCIDGWVWCDVLYGGVRGWMAGNYIQYTYDNRPVLLPDYGARIGIPIVSFAIGAYWGSYYRDRPFYRQRDYWYHRPMPHRPPPPPAHRPPPVRPRPPAQQRPPGPARPPMHGQRPPQPSRPPAGNGRPPSHGTPPPSRPSPGDHRPRPPATNPPGRPAPGQGNQRPPPGQDNRGH